MKKQLDGWQMKQTVETFAECGDLQSWGFI